MAALAALGAAGRLPAVPRKSAGGVPASAVHKPTPGRSHGAVHPGKQASRLPAVPMLIASGEDEGFLEPCGCSSPQIGGLPRRASLILAHPGSIPVDNGDWVAGVGRQDQLKAQATVQFFSRFHYAACNLGERDYALGYTLLSLYRQNSLAPFLSTNVLRAGAPAFAPFVLARRGALRIAIFGELSPSLADVATASNPGLTVADPAAALTQWHPRAPADLSILLFHGPAVEARAIVRHCPWISLIVTAHEGEEPSQPQGTPPTMSPGERARFVSRAILQRGAVHPLPALSLDPSFKDAAGARAILGEYQAQVVVENLLAQTPRAPLQGNWYAGSASCASCHTSAYRVWSKSGHAHAYADLIHVGHSRDPDCVSCHVIGLDRVGGFTSSRETPKLANVGCESCHGPQGLHAAGKGLRPEHLSRGMCVPCHTPEQSPRFDVVKYWPKIAH